MSPKRNKPKKPNSPQSQSLFSRLELLLLPFLLAAVVLVHWQVFMARYGDEKHLAGDIVTKDYPARVEFLRELRQGHWPAWSMDQLAGWPGGIANCEVSPLYPFNLALLFFWQDGRFPYLVFEWFLALHLIFAGWGCARLGKRLGLSNPAATIAGLCFACTGFLIAKRQYVSLIEVMAWYPWVWWALEGYLGRRRLQNLLLLAGSLFCLLAAGHPQMAFYVLLALFIRVVHFAWRGGKTWTADKDDDSNAPVTPQSFASFGKPLLGYGVAALLAFLLTAAMWMPFLGLVSQGERTGASYEDSATLALEPEELFDLAFPEQMPPVPEESGGLQVSDSWGVEIFYVGIVTLFLAVLSLVCVRRGGASEAMLIVAAAGVLLSFGPLTRLHDFLFVLTPWLSSVRAASRWMGIVALPMHLAAGKGIDYLRERKAGAVWPKWILAAGGVWAAALLFLILIMAAMRISSGGASESADSFLGSLFMAGIFTVLFALLVWLRDTRRVDNGILCLGLGLLLWFDLTAHAPQTDLREGPGGFVKDDVVKELTAASANYRTKIFLYEGLERGLYSGAVFDFEEVDGESPLKPLETIETTVASAVQYPQTNHLLLELLGVRFILNDKPGLNSPWELKTGPWNERGIYLWEHTNPLPRARFCGDSLSIAPELLPAQVPGINTLSVQDFPKDCVALFFEPDGYAPAQENPVWQIGKTEIELSGTLLVHSGALYGVRQQALVYWRGKQVSPNQPGYNIVAIDPSSGEVIAADAFNLLDDYVAINGVMQIDPQMPVNRRLAAFIDSLPPECAVIIANRHQTTNIIMEPALKAIRSCGAALDLRRQDGIAHVVVGSKGTSPGTAYEVASATEAMFLVSNQGARFALPELVDADPVRYVPAAGVRRQEWDMLMESKRPARFPLSYNVGNATFTVPIEVYSAPHSGIDDAPNDSASIVVGGIEAARNEPGYNLVAVDPNTWKVIDSRVFKIIADYDPQTIGVLPGAPVNRAMSEFLRSFPRGTLIAGAIRDEAANVLQAETVEAMRSIGLEIDMRKRYRWGHAFVGVVGASSGTAVEVASEKPCALMLVDAEQDNEPRVTDLSEELEDQELVLKSGFQPVTVGLDKKPFEKLKRAPQPKQYPLSDGASPEAPDAENTEWTFQMAGPNRVVCTGWAASPGWLVTSERFAPGWKASVDGEDVPIYRAFRYFRSVRLESGYHEVVFTYHLPGAAQGGALSIGALIVFIGLIVYVNLARKSGRVIRV